MATQRQRKNERAKRKEARQSKRTARMAERKGISLGQAEKLKANRKARRRELFKDPEGGSYTKKYDPFSDKAGVSEITKSGPQKLATQNIAESIAMDASSLSKIAAPNSGGGFKTSSDSALNRTDIGSNATKMYMKKKGY